MEKNAPIDQSFNLSDNQSDLPISLKERMDNCDFELFDSKK